MIALTHSLTHSLTLTRTNHLPLPPNSPYFPLIHPYFIVQIVELHHRRYKKDDGKHSCDTSVTFKVVGTDVTR